MATIRPFRGLRYSAAAGDPHQLVAPPYDVISPEQREALAAQSPHNVVFLTLPEQMPDDRSKFVKYARSASRLEAWRREGILARDEEPSYYRYTQTFAMPGSGETFSRMALITTIKVEPYEKGVVLPHEQTFPKHKEDRLRVLEATRAHLECIYGLFEDDDQAAFHLIQSAPAEAVLDVTDPDGVRHQVERISDPEVNCQIAGALLPKKVWIADGHHRYETALAFREMQGPREGDVAEDYMMMALTSISDPGLSLLPTHRILKTMPLPGSELKAKMAEHFEVSDCPNREIPQLLKSRSAAGARVFGVALPGGNGFVARVADASSIARQIDGEGSARLKELDVSILHRFIFEKLLGLTGHDFFGYTRLDQEALDAVENGAPASFLMNPPTVDDMRWIAVGGEKMPQKSTYYYPKIMSGLVVWSLNDYA